MPATDATKNGALRSRRSFSWLLAGAGLAVALLVVDVILTLRNTSRLNEDAAWVARTHEVMASLESVLSLAKDAESGAWGFAISGNDRFLEPYTKGVAAIDREVVELERLTAHDPDIQVHIPELRKRITNRLQILDGVVSLRKDQEVEASLEAIASGRGKQEMNALRVVVAEMMEHEQNLLRERSRTSARTYRAALLTGFLSGLSALAAVSACSLLLWWHLAERTRAAAVIAEQGERLRTTLASIGDAVITTDTAGLVTNLNAVAESLTGWKNDEAIGQPLATVFHIVNEETRQPVANPATKALTEGVVVGLANHTILIAKDGTERPIDDSAAPIRCAEGEIVGCVLVFRDVAERRRAERVIEDARNYAESIVDTVREPLIILDADLRVKTASRSFCQTFHVTPEGTENRLLYDLGNGQWDIPDLRRLLEEVLPRDNQVNDFEMEHAFEHIGTKTMLLNARRLIQATDQAPLILLAIEDITERKRLANELRQVAAELSEADRRKNEFLAMLAHELRNPLAPIRNALQILLLTEGNEAVQSVSAIMERQVNHMVHLVDDLLDVSRISRGKIDLRQERVELASIIEQAIETSRPMIAAAGHELTVSLPPQPIYLHADGVRLAQVFSNLLNNSCKYSEPDGHIWLSVERQGSDVLVSVKDTGLGIPAAMLPKVFEMFTQVDRSLERSQGGLGIGLSLVKSLVQMHGGSVEALSEGVGKGSTFLVRLPVLLASGGREPPDTARAGEKYQGPPPPRSPPRRILVVDDNRDSAQTLAMLLKITGSETRLAHDGLHAVEAAADFRPDVILLDIGLPKLNGYEVARKIREQPWGQPMVLVALTGWGQDEDRQKSKDAGFDGHMVKPVDYAALMKLLAELLAVPV